MMPFGLQQSSPTHVQRGKKASIQQLHYDDDEEDLETFQSVMPRDTSTTLNYGMRNHDCHETTTATSTTTTTTTASGPTTSPPSNSSTKRTNTSSRLPRQQQRFRWLVERMVSNPLLSMFACGGRTSNASSTTSSLSVSPSSSWLSSHPRHHSSFRSQWQGGTTIHNQAPHWIVQTMKQFPYQTRIQRMGCSALKDLAKDSWPMKQRIVEQVGGVECILKAMRHHAQDALLQELALECLYELVAGNLSEQLVERGVVGIVLQTMEGHVEEEEVIIMACNVLLALTDHGPGSVECLRQKLGGVILAKLEYSFRGRNGEISKKASELLRRLYL